MRYQPPDLNNPANPLFKVAALILDKESSQSGTDSTIRVLAQLTFKKSSDLRGFAHTKSGLPVTVCFSLAIRRASFQLSFRVEDPEATVSQLLKFSEIAYSASLGINESVSGSTTAARNQRVRLGAGGSADIAFGGSGVAAAARAQAKLAAETATRKTAQRKKAAKYERNNISVTADGDTIHWDINPSFIELAIEADSPAFLDGELFLAPGGTKPKRIDACKLIWRRVRAKTPLVIHGSVFVRMDDLDVRDVRLLSDVGEELKLRKIEDNAASTFESMMPDQLSFTKAKERFVKQIVRKHLVSQGMVVEGARVEICKAYA